MIGSPEPWRVLVVVPAHDEAGSIGRCLRSLRCARGYAARHGVRSDVLVVADACTDETGEVARGLLQGWGEVMVVDELNVGRARALGVRRGLESLGRQRLARTWIANTDADSAVPPTWLCRQLAWASAGFVAVAGTVRLDSFEQYPPGLRERFLASYEAAMTSDNPHIHGANLGVRADAYLAMAGWPPVALAEDHGLWNRLRQSCLPAVSDPDLQVLTSGRAVGRAPGGFADSLVALAATVGVDTRWTERPVD